MVSSVGQLPLRWRAGEGLVALPRGCGRVRGGPRTTVRVRATIQQPSEGGARRRNSQGVSEGGGAMMDGQKAHAHAVGKGDMAISLADSYRTTLPALAKLNPGEP